MKFTKMHGTGNDFVVIANWDKKIQLDAATIARLCDRHFGIGADGLISAESSEQAEIFMNYYNGDGSLAEMCGNGVRCLAKFAVDNGLVSHAGAIAVETRAGIVGIDVREAEDDTAVVRVDMGEVDFRSEKIPVLADTAEVLDATLEFEGRSYRYGCASMGNPHMTILVEDLDDCPIDRMGPYFEKHPMFPEGCNISFAQVLDRGHIRMDTWERGAGRTLACGTGTCAAVAVLGRLGCVDDKVEATLSGGKLQVEVQGRGITMTGPATTVFSGEITIKERGSE
jgi:diaminopimelate epimerase